jgi:hypothetical protein
MFYVGKGLDFLSSTDFDDKKQVIGCDWSTLIT